MFIPTYQVASEREREKENDFLLVLYTNKQI
jgi:hypothetical protein